MASMSKIRSDKKQTAKKSKVQDKEQSERFIETARSINAMKPEKILSALHQKYWLRKIEIIPAHIKRF